MNLVMKPSKETIAFSAKEFENSEDLVNSVAADKSGIGYVGWAYVGSKAHALSIVSSSGVPVKPTIFGIKTAEYPLTRRLFLYTNGQPSEPLAEKLESFALSDDARKVIDRNGYVVAAWISFPSTGRRNACFRWRWAAIPRRATRARFSRTCSPRSAPRSPSASSPAPSISTPKATRI